MLQSKKLVGENVVILAEKVRLNGILFTHEKPTGLIIFAHGSGSSRMSSRNQMVARYLHERGFATLLFDLLTEDEERIDIVTRQFRFDVSLLEHRLQLVTQWAKKEEKLKNLPLAYFGASTGAAAALIAAASLGSEISALVSRGGRPDLAQSALSKVRAPTLLIVGGADFDVVDLNRQAQSAMKKNLAQMAIVPNATHLFEEAGALEKVAELAADWFEKHLHTQIDDFIPIDKQDRLQKSPYEQPKSL